MTLKIARGRADAEGQRQERDEYETGAAPERSPRVAKVLRELRQPPHGRLPSPIQSGCGLDGTRQAFRLPDRLSGR